ncbi:ARM repeat-containing protein [Gonapodya prolifera JEL478]|uniref:ARM repeat-containing protein n=1 Tax=Gonapodya prolifera (strain JEL478) TaxID=1344416 RepID=A0A139A686_GONPJ|nr:ARM repeat-containing protein [Gonapodya prolifera JEL478]|eukprot:KXS12168.1 ARM repeat-containing protein [Gonapodya prolifera JEL478]
MQRRPHSAAPFQIRQESRPELTGWFKTAKSFLASGNRDLFPLDERAGNINSTNTKPQLEASNEIALYGAIVAAPQVFLLESNFQSQFEDVLETAVVHVAVQLTANLGHWSDTVRSQCVAQLLKLGEILDTGTRSSTNQQMKATEAIRVAFQVDDQGFQDAVHKLFGFVAPSLSSMAVSLVAALECFYSHSDQSVRSVCVAALTELIFQNQRNFVEEDRLVAVWNLYFSLNGIDGNGLRQPVDRIVNIFALGLLSPLYCRNDIALARNIVMALLKLNFKTDREKSKIKDALVAIFSNLTSSRKNIPRNSFTAVSAVTSPSAEGPVGPHGGADPFNLYDLFLSILNPNEEQAYDLLPWALEAYTKALLSLESRSLPLKENDDISFLLPFVLSLANHFRAVPALVRYGACVCLHTVSGMWPGLMKHPDLSDWLWGVVITGVLDTDYSTSFLYFEMLETLIKTEFSSTTELMDILKNARRESVSKLDYDSRFHTRQKRLVDFLEAIMTRIPKRLSPQRGVQDSTYSKWVHRLANSLDYVPGVQKLRILDLIKVWGASASKANKFLFQALAPLLSHDDVEVQCSAIDVMRSLVSTLGDGVESNELEFLWQRAKILATLHTKLELLQKFLDLFVKLLVNKLLPETRKDMLNVLFSLVFHSEETIRNQVYDLLGGVGFSFWKASGMMNTSLGILVLCLGDIVAIAAKYLLTHLSNVTTTKTFNGVLNALASATISYTSNDLVRYFDELGNSFFTERSECRNLVDAIIDPNLGDAFWRFWMGDVQDNQLAHPDEYNFSKIFIHAPFWVPILFTKLGVPPLPLSGNDDGRSRETIPSSIASKRRWHMSYVSCVLPCTGIPDPMVRRSACAVVIRCCFRYTTLRPAILRSLLHYIQAQMVVHKQWTYQLSALDLLKSLIRLKMPIISSAVLTFYLDLALDLAANSPVASVKLGALEFVESSILVFPRAMEQRLNQTRDIVRVMLVDANPSIAQGAFRVFPLIFSSVRDAAMASEFLEYLRGEVRSVTVGAAERAGDPLVAKLNVGGRTRVLRASILSIGALAHKSTGSASAQELLLFLKHTDPILRMAAVQSLWALVPQIDEIEASVVQWTLLALYADPCLGVRLAFTLRLRKIPSPQEALKKIVTPHNEDAPGLATEAKWEDLLKDDAEIKGTYKEMTEIGADLENLLIHPTGPLQLLPEDDGFNLPEVSEKLMQRIKILSRTLANNVPPVRESEVIYFLQDLQKNPLLRAPSVLVLSEFCCQHESSQLQIIEVIVNQLGTDILPDNRVFIEACLVGVRNISEFMPSLFKQVVEKLMSSSVPSEGELVALLYTFDFLRDVYPGKSKEIVSRCNRVIVSGRYSQRKRLYAVYLAAEASLITGGDDLVQTLDSVQTFIGQADDEETRKKIFSCLGRVMSHQGAKHSVFKQLLTSAKRDTKARSENARLRSMNVFRLFIKYLNPEEAVWFALMFMIDNETNVCTVAGKISLYCKYLASNDLFMKAPAVLGQFPSTMMLNDFRKKGETVRRNCAADLQTSRWPDSSIDKIVSVPLDDQDNLNAIYFASDRRLKFSKVFGVSKTLSSTLNVKPITSLLHFIEERLAKIEDHPPEVVAARESLYLLDITSLVKEFVKRYTSVSIEIADTMMQEIMNCDSVKSLLVELIEGLVAKDGTGSTQSEEVLNTELDFIVRQIQMLSNILFVMDGMKDISSLSTISMLTGFGKACPTNAEITRGDLYASLENSFFFFNEHAEIPIVTEEHQVHRSTICQKQLLVSPQTERLRRFTTVALQATLAFGLYHAVSPRVTDADLVHGFTFLMSLLDNPHRGIRASAVDCLSMIVERQLVKMDSSPAHLLSVMSDTLENMLSKFDQEDSELDRKKSDIVFLIAHFCPYTTSKDVRLKVISLLVNLWRDPDSEVRATSIDAIEELGRKGVPEVLESWRIVKSEDREQTDLLIQEVSALIADRDYLDKERLQQLLKFPFKKGSSSF